MRGIPDTSCYKLGAAKAPHSVQTCFGIALFAGPAKLWYVFGIVGLTLSHMAKH